MLEEYSKFVNQRNIEGSNKAASYIRALTLLDEILKQSSLLGIHDFWSISSIEKIGELYEYALRFQKKEGSVFLQKEFPPSYGRNGYYSAALKSYQQFLYENKLWDLYQNTDTSPVELSQRLEKKADESIEQLIFDPKIDLKTREGKDALREVKTRVGQRVFRKMILSQYQNQCCVTGLNIPEVLRASHISGWAQDPLNRMNPANGLCLSATYDAAFDKHLISFDPDFRMILSSSLKDYYTNDAFKEYFLQKEGAKITKPTQFLPDQILLEKHREQMVG